MRKILNKNLNTYIKFISIILFIIIIIGYALFQARSIATGPIINIHSPQNGASVDTSLIEINGVAKHISHISMNGRQIFTDDKGVFNEELLLSYGYNIITIRAKDRFNREVTEELELIYK